MNTNLSHYLLHFQETYCLFVFIIALAQACYWYEEMKMYDRRSMDIFLDEVGRKGPDLTFIKMKCKRCRCKDKITEERSKKMSTRERKHISKKEKKKN